jgi:hypothetical protein
VRASPRLTSKPARKDRDREKPRQLDRQQRWPISMDQREAYLSITCSAVASRSVVTRAMPKALPGLSRTMTTVTGREPDTEYHRHVMTAAATVSVLL